MVKSADEVLLESKSEIVAHVLTDQVDKAQEIGSHLKKIKVMTHKIQPYAWPEATLFRYRLINEITSHVSQDLVMHLDADMLIKSDFISELPLEFQNDIALVMHPGFYRPPGLKKIKFYWQNKNYIPRDAGRFINLGKLGDWETSRLSQSFVKRKNRKNYVCGGTWFGLNDAFFRMTHELSLLELADTENGVLPKWHDESILNHWASCRDVTLLPPSFCFEPNYPHLKSLNEYIRAVDKNE
jgi:hypothetical protein